jgi:FRG domain
VEKQLGASKGSAIWHRGCADFKNDTQTPGLYRHPTVKEIKKLLELEVQMLSRFRQRSMPFLDRPIEDDWERMFLMQHFRVPTRLLDWTENPFVALYFALTSTPEEPGADAVVWMLDPVVWNRKSLDHITFQEGILSTDDSRLEYLKPGAEVGMMNADPVAIYGFHNSPRIVAQRGVFTIFGTDTDPLEKIYATRDYPEDCLIKVRVPKDDKPKLLASLFQFGFTHSVIFPDLEGLAKEMKNFFKFGD